MIMIETLNDAGRLWAGYFVPALVQNTVFLALVFLALRYFRGASAGVKYAIAAVGLVKLLLPPFVPTGLIVPAAGEQVAFPASTLLFSFTNLSAGAEAVPPDTPAGLDLFGAFFIVWIAIAFFVLARAVRATVRLAERVRGAKPVVGEPAMEAASPRESRRIGVFKSSRIGMPLTIGVLPRRVYVPDSWDRWTPECRRAVLRHEIAHIRRRDGFFQSLEIVAQALYFFHPLVWMLNRRLRAFREMACDDASVGRDRSSRLSYSRLLVEMAETALSPPVACESASALLRRKHDLLARVAYQVKEGDMLSVSKKKLAVIMAALIVTMLPLSMYLGGARTAATDVAKAGEPKSEKVKSEKAKSAQAKADLTKVNVVIKKDNVTIDGKKMGLDQFGEQMAKIAHGNPESVVTVINCDGDVPMGKLYKVQQMLLENELNKVSYVDGVGNDMPVILPSDNVKKKLHQVSKENMLFLMVDASGEIHVNKEPVKSAKVAKVVEKMLQDNPNLIISIYTDEKTPYKDFAFVFGQVKKAGANKVVVNNPVG
jgi:beta-lactamase regulating signal transducer with metallopeptidase domain